MIVKSYVGVSASDLVNQLAKDCDRNYRDLVIMQMTSHYAENRHHLIVVLDRPSQAISVYK